MRSLRELYRIGTGPSSSHSMAPRTASMRFKEKYPDAHSYRVTLYGSLASTGKGHMTDEAISGVLGNEVEIVWLPDLELPLHTNGMKFEALDEHGNVEGVTEDYSLGGGALRSDKSLGDVYSESSAHEILTVVRESYGSYWEYVIDRDEGIKEYLRTIWDTMVQSIERGLSRSDRLPGRLNLPRKANAIYNKSKFLEVTIQEKMMTTAYAYAVSEENASAGIVATAPTCGACGVVPAVLRFMEEKMHPERDDILHALATAGMFGNLIKTNASISGAYVGCQGEVGAACAMAAAAACQIIGGTPRQIEYAAEMGLEHHLGLTCDPVYGLVQIPCIERNAHAALRAIDCAYIAIFSDGDHHISFDDVVQVMLETGMEMSKDFKETSEGGLAKVYAHRFEMMGEAE